MDLLRKTDLKTLIAERKGAQVSLFMPAHRRGAEQDPIRLKNLLAQGEKRLVAGGMRSPEALKLLAPGRKLLEESSFWKQQSDGLACFLSAEGMKTYRLPVAFTEQVVVGDHYHVKPLLPLLAGDGRFFVLAVSQNQVRLLQGTAQGIHEVDLKGVPANLAEALRFHDRDEPLLYHTRPAGGRGSWTAIFHGQGVGIDDAKDDLLRYFQQIDRGLHEVLRNERAPLVLAAVEYLWPIYARANTYPHFLEKGIPGNPDHLSNKELHALGWAIVQPYFQEAQEKAAALFEQLAGTGRTSNDIEEIVRASHEGRIEVLFVAGDCEHWGVFDAAAGHVDLHDREEPGDEALLNFAAVHTILHGGEVYVVARDRVPGSAMQAALFWLPIKKKGR